MDMRSVATATRRARDVRLDFFRGLGMFIIFIAHVPDNKWNDWIPARFGASDATEVFVFCSGMASALAFGAVFRDRSFALGLARTVQRVWQVYWAHLGLFVVTVGLLVALNEWRQTDFYTIRLFVLPFLNAPGEHVMGLLTLQYVPNYFDILPMYLVILAMMPVVVWLGLRQRWLAFAFMGALWLGAQVEVLEFQAEVRDLEREWFFNPFGWQLVFFTGFAFVMGWLKPPPVRTGWVLLALGVLVFNLVFATRWGWRHEVIFEARDMAMWAFDKTDFGVVRYTHFLAIAYLAYVLAGEGGRRLAGGGLWGRFVEVVRKVGQQSLPIFLTGMVLAQVAGAALDIIGRTPATTAAVNVAGFAVLTAVAFTVAWFKREPWRAAPARLAAPVRESAGH